MIDLTKNQQKENLLDCSDFVSDGQLYASQINTSWGKNRPV